MSAPTPSHYDLLGGDAGVRALVDRFYDLMDTAPEAAGIRALHAASLKVSREKLHKFLCGWTGGPQLYVEQYGHPRLRMRHMQFRIGVAERNWWMDTMRTALEDAAIPEPERTEMARYFEHAATFLINAE